MNRIVFAVLLSSFGVVSYACDCVKCGCGGACACDAASYVSLSTDKATARISLDGARVVSFKVGDDEVLWSTRVPPDTKANWCHGGIPVCWPWFGRAQINGKTAIHGFVKSCRFELVSLSQSKERSQVVLRLKSDERTRSMWPHDFEITYEAILTDTLRLSLRTVNTGKDTFSYTAGFHPYFRLGDRNRAFVTGMDGLGFCDSRVKREIDGVWSGDMALNRSYDHVFNENGASSSHSIVDPSLGRRIYATASGVSRLVVWTADASDPVKDPPGPGKLGPGDWQYFACVEPAFIWKDREVVLNPGERQQFVYEVSVSPVDARTAE